MAPPQQMESRPLSRDVGDGRRIHDLPRRTGLVCAFLCGVLLIGSPILAQPPVLRFVESEIPPLPSYSATSELDLRPVPAIHHSAFIGSQSCAASSCHGDPRRETVVGASANYFFDRDKHQLAGTVLRSQRSIEIANRLKLKTNPWQARECLVCHAPGAVDITDRTTLSARISEGVSCESCHGAARDWLVPHRSVEWNFSDIRNESHRTQSGFIDTKSLASRIDRCADCHVGNASQMVNHDLIAAGHPRLAFEFAAYQARMPIHWRQADERLRSPVATHASTWNRSTYEARNWLLGQIVNADHELAMLEGAANARDSTWPELSQYDCFACHHELASPNWRQARQAWNLRAGELSWGTWNLGLITEIQPILSNSLSPTLVSGQDQLRQQLKTLSVDKSDVLDIVLPLRRVLAEAKVSLANVPLDENELRLIRDTLLSQHETISGQGWDRSTQLFLASIALEKGAHDSVSVNHGMSPARIAQYERLRSLLAFKEKGKAVPPFHHIESPARLELNHARIRAEFELLMLPDAVTNGAGQNLKTVPSPLSTSAPETD